jgi:radical SAM superfamily enzyme YgiQ (UPF0313 family)
VAGPSSKNGRPVSGKTVDFILRRPLQLSTVAVRPRFPFPGSPRIISSMEWEQKEKLRRQLGREKGTIIKDWGGRLPFALVYPNSYNIGMSSLGVHTLYRLLNTDESVLCERAFWEKEYAPRGWPVLSLESQRPLTDFAVIAFSLTYELDYFNVARVLQSNNIPLYARERSEADPLIIAGGPCMTVNPMPLAPFFDAIAIGEAEPILPHLLPVLKEHGGGKRPALLAELSALPGIYVPQLPPQKPVARQWAPDLDALPPTATVVFTPDTELGDLFLLEIERGCNRGCRFCLVSQAFRPMRWRSLDNLLAQAEPALKYKKRLGLVGPAVSDYPCLDELLLTLGRRGIPVSASSLRVKPLSLVVVKELARTGTQTVTLAPEAGSERLRRLIKKDVSGEDVLTAVDKVSAAGIRQIKLYFMIGLPEETDDDVEAIIALAAAARAVMDRHKTRGRLTLNVSPFIPKASTPYERQPMADLVVLKRRLRRLKEALPAHGVTIKVEGPEWSEVQTVLSRGDATLAPVIAEMETLSLAAWYQAVARHKLDVAFFAHQEWPKDMKLPWSVVDLGG